MHTVHHMIQSSRLGREMPFKSYGHSGKPMIVFPSRGGRYHEYEDFGMIEACRPFIESGAIRVYTTDSIDLETGLDRQEDPTDQARLQYAYEIYITSELIPSIQYHEPGSMRFIATGCSTGGYQAASLFFRHPDLFDTLISLSGVYDAKSPASVPIGIFDDVLRSPAAYLKNVTDPWFLERYRSNSIILCTGQGALEERSIKDTHLMEAILKEKNVPAWIDYWGNDASHDWSWWRLQIAYFLERLVEERRLERNS